MDKIRILVIEENRILREGVTSMLSKQRDMQVKAALGNNGKLIQMMEQFNPGILLLTYGLQNQQSLQFIKEIRKQFQEIKIIVNGFTPIQSDVLEYVQAGVSGFILKEASAAQFVETIRKINKGTKLLPPYLTGSLFTQIVEHAIVGLNPSIKSKLSGLTKREREVIELIAEGFTNKDIAQKLGLSLLTVKSHVHNVLEKLSLSTRLQIAKHFHLSEPQKTT